MSEAEIIRRWTAERPIYSAWGSFIIDEVRTGLRGRMRDEDLESFLRIPPKARLKGDRSLVDKALFRDKLYNDPYQQITDKVGVRFVVLLDSDIQFVQDVICACDAWAWSKDKDFEGEKRSRPVQFDYQSVHYILTSKKVVSVDGVDVPLGTPCEVQIRTLLQHAHSELSHSNIYKPKTSATPEMLRAAAMSMALIEATSEYFEKVAKTTKQANKSINETLQILVESYRSGTGFESDVGKVSSLVLDAYREQLTVDVGDQLKALLVAKPWIFDRIKTKVSDNYLYRQPAILLVFLLSATAPNIAKENWPLTDSELRPVFVDLGISYDD